MKGARRKLPRARRGAPRASIGPRRGAQTIEGRYTRARGGFGFVAVSGPAAARFPRDVFIARGAEGDALDGDLVRVEVLRRERGADRVAGRIVAVLEHGHERVIGTLTPVHARAARTSEERWLVLPQNDRLPAIELFGASELGAGDRGKLALVRLRRSPQTDGTLAGELERVLGEPGDPETQFLSIALEHGLRIEFPSEVLAEASRLPDDPAPADLAGREDLRDLAFVTIDGETARDFDDAVHLERSREGYRLRVAIADVSFYVRPGSALDREAALRGTSVYFPDRAVPMLPEKLSTTLCSLQPGRDRLVVVVDLLLDRHGRTVATRASRAVIRSRARLTYTRVAAALSAAETPELERFRHELEAEGGVLTELRLMLGLMRELYRRRVAAGSLDLDLPEALVDLSVEGKSIGVRLSVRNDAHRIIEELMLAANRAVAELLSEHGVPFPFRIHEPPRRDDAEELNRLLGPFGLHLDHEEEVRPKDVQRLLDALEGHPLARVLTRQVLRSLTQARYTTQNAGHFGLAFESYCHFTSPIRRYPDLLVHRQLCRVLEAPERAERHARGATGGDAAEGEAAVLEAASIASSEAERRAMEAERAMLDLKKAEFMLDHLLEPEPAMVVSVASFGVFVEIDAYPIEGLVRIEQLADDSYFFDEASRSLIGSRTGKRIRLGDRLLVEATSVSLSRRRIDFALVKRLGPGDSGAGEPPARARRAPRGSVRALPRSRRPKRRGE